MLVLTRDVGSKTCLTLPTDPVELAKLAGSRITVTVCATTRSGLRLGFEADRSINIARDDAGTRNTKGDDNGGNE